MQLRTAQLSVGGKLRIAGVTIAGSDITSKALDVAIQPGKASLSQWEQIGNAMKHAKDNGIQFNLKFIK